MRGIVFCKSDDRRNGIAHLMSHDAEDAVVVKFAGFKFKTVAAIKGYDAVHRARHLLYFAVVGIDVEAHGAVVALQSCHKCRCQMHSLP